MKEIEYKTKRNAHSVFPVNNYGTSCSWIDHFTVQRIAFRCHRVCKHCCFVAWLRNLFIVAKTTPANINKYFGRIFVVSLCCRIPVCWSPVIMATHSSSCSDRFSTAHNFIYVKFFSERFFWLPSDLRSNARDFSERKMRVWASGVQRRSENLAENARADHTYATAHGSTTPS